MSQQQGVVPEEDYEDFDQFLDSEKLAINKVYNDLMTAHNARPREMGALQREIRERFAEIGFVVRVDFYEKEHEEHLSGVQIPEVSFLGRCEPQKVGDFDHERMGHEVRSNIIGAKGQDNVQKTQVAPGWAKSKSGLVVPD